MGNILKVWDEETGQYVSLLCIRGEPGEQGPKGDPGEQGPQGEPGPAGASAEFPEGGAVGQVLVKTETGEAWADQSVSLPDGGVAGQVLAKKSDVDGDVSWQNFSSSEFYYGTGDPPESTIVHVNPEGDSVFEVYTMQEVDTLMEELRTSIVESISNGTEVLY